MEDLGIKLLQRLSSSLMSVEGVPTGRKVGLSLNVLKELGRWTDRAPAGPNVSPTARKRPKALARHAQLDPYPFDCMGIGVPMTEDEVRAVCGDILPELQSVLEVRISLPLRLGSKHSSGFSATFSS